MEARWVLREKAREEETAGLRNFIQNEVLVELLAQRGITQYEQAEAFFNPDLTQVHDPLLMDGMRPAIERIHIALEEGQKIMLLGDYDVDGTTAVAMTYSFFKTFYPNAIYYIPDRYKEGYGISKRGIDYAVENDVSLIISLDCGIRSVEEVDYANTKGIDFIICDHHLPGEELPDAVAILDPKKPGCSYPYKELTGCGIGFKLMCALASEFDFIEVDELTYLDLVAVSIACDIVPITGENRTLMAHGLVELNKQKRAGVKALLDASGKRGMMDVTSVVFTIGPRINAAGRLEHANRAVELLLEEDSREARTLAQHIHETNERRKELDRDTTDEAIQMIHDRGDQSRYSTVVYGEHWNKGVVGIVASRLIEKFYRPTIVLTRSNGLITGSARSIEGFDIHRALTNCSGYLTQYGGHKFAAGMTLQLENLEKFREKFEEEVKSVLTEDKLREIIYVDAELDFSEIKGPFFKSLERMRPFGPGNMTPIFMTRNVVDAGGSKAVGNGKHLKLKLLQKMSGPATQDAIAFGKGEFAKDFQNGQPFDIVYTLERNEWQGRSTIQLNVRDLKPST